MSLKLFLFLVPVAAGGWYVAHRDAAADPATVQASAAATPARKSAAECRALEERLLQASAANPTDNGFEAMRRVNAMYRELTSQGCAPGGGPGTPFEAPSNRMGAAPAGAAAPRADGTSFQPGRPMVDVSRDRSR
jgi:hypothetical protein